jgi:hypothetical protein
VGVLEVLSCTPISGKHTAPLNEFGPEGHRVGLAHHTFAEAQVQQIKAAHASAFLLVSHCRYQLVGVFLLLVGPRETIRRIKIDKDKDKDKDKD